MRADSRYRKIENLRGTSLALPPAVSAIARMLRHTLFANKLVPVRDMEVRSCNSHDSRNQQEWAGTAGACGTTRPPISVFEQRMQAKLGAICDTPPIPHVACVAQPCVAVGIRERLQAGMLTWKDSEEGRKILQSLGFGEIAPVNVTDYRRMPKFRENQ